MRRLDSACALATGLAKAEALILLALIFLASSCGYQSQLAGSMRESASVNGNASATAALSSRAPTRIAVLSLRNDSPEPWLDRIVSDAMRREIGSRAVFDLMNDPERAEMVVRGRIRPLDTNSQSFSRFVAALEFGLTLQLDVEVVLASGNIIRLDSRTLSESDVYLASPDIEVTRTNRLEALRRLSDILATRLADSIEMLERPIPSNPASSTGATKPAATPERG